MRILVVHNRYQHRGGEDECFDTETSLLRQNGNEVIEYVEHNDGLADSSAFDKACTAVRLTFDRRQYRAIRTIIREQHPDVVHVHNFFPLISPAVHYAATAEGVPVVQTLHNFRLLCPGAYMFRDGHICESCAGKLVPLSSLRYGCYRGSRAGTAAIALMSATHGALRTWHRKVSYFITPSYFARAKFIAAGLSADKLVVKPNCVYPEPEHAAGRRSYAAFVGRLSAEKGILTLLAAWEKLGGHLALKIIGDGPLAPEVASAAARIPGVERLGRQSLAETYKVIGGARFLVVPSESYETFGRVVIEAFAHGTPVIGSNLGGIGELITHGCTGLHFRSGDADDLLAQVQWACNNPLQLADIAHAARLEYERKYTAQQNYQQLINIYGMAIGHVSNPPYSTYPATTIQARESERVRVA